LRNETLKAATLRTGEDCLEKLAQCFPGAMPVRVPARVVARRAGGRGLQENVIVEFVTASEALFLSELPLEFNDSVRLEFADAGVEADASVVALQYHDGRKAVAARFAMKLGLQLWKR
jgi:hypothetical protein